MIREEAEQRLGQFGEAEDAVFPLFDAAVACALHEDGDRDPAAAYELLEEGGHRLAYRLQTQAPEQALAQALGTDLSLGGDALTYDALHNADLLSVCERRKGLPVALGLFYLAAARECRLDLRGVDFPGHFMLRLETGNGPMAIDAFTGGRVVMPSELTRRALHVGLPPTAADQLDELMRPVSDRRVLIRLQNNILARARHGGNLAAAERASLRWALLDPLDFRPWIDLASAREAGGQLAGAIDALTRAESLGGASAYAVDRMRERVRKRLN